MAIFVCPALCGCELEIEGRWAHPPGPDGKYHAFPIRDPQRPGKPSTVSSIRIVSVCPAHASWQADPLPADPYFGADGYYDIPAAPTPAEKLFIRFYTYVGMRAGFYCGCKAGAVMDRRLPASPPTLLAHPQHSRRCLFHHADADHQIAAREHAIYAHARMAAEAELPDVTPILTATGQGTPAFAVTLDVPGAGAAAKQRMTAAIAAAVGVGKVTVR